MPNHDLSEDLHTPGRAHCLEGLEEHLNVAARLARALWNAIDGIDGDIDPRDKLGLYELASTVADHASAARFCYYISAENSVAAPPADDPVFAALDKWRALDGERTASDRDAVFKTSPATKAGALALLKFVTANLGEGESAFAHAILAAVEAIEGAQQ